MIEVIFLNEFITDKVYLCAGIDVRMRFDVGSDANRNMEAGDCSYLRPGVRTRRS